MNVFASIVLVVQVLAAIGVIVLVLLQHGKGADMGAAFGSGTSGSLFGATGSANFLSRSTAALATVFFVCTLLLAYLANKTSHPEVRQGGSVMEQPAKTGPAPAPSGVPMDPSKPAAPQGSAPAPAGADAAPAMAPTTPAKDATSGAPKQGAGDIPK
jgi:preprotein translocase subunit SecG